VPSRRVLTIWGALGIAGILTIGACTDQGDDPRSPGPLGSTLTGHVRLVARLTDEINGLVGLQHVDDADGVLVRLTAAGVVVDSTRTAAGAFIFAGVLPGTYRAEVVVTPASAVVGDELAVADVDVAAPDTLVVPASEGLATYPNPGVDEGVAIEFTAHAAQTYLVEVRALDGELVWSYAAEVPAGFYHVHWSGEELEKHHAPEGAYWIAVHVDGDILRSLVFWPGEPDVPNPGHCGHIEAGGFLIQQDGVTLVSGWGPDHQGSLAAASGGWTPALAMAFLDADSTFFAIADSCPDNFMTWTLADTNVASVELFGDAKWSFRIRGKQAGATDLTLHGWHDDHIHYNTPPIRLVVAAPVRMPNSR
jgi:hypothetical protein